MKSGEGSMLDMRWKLLTFARRIISNNLRAQARSRSRDMNYLPGPAVQVSESIVAGVAPPASKRQVEDNLGVAGDWTLNQEEVLTVMIEIAKTLRVVEALERWGGNSKATARGNDSTMAGKAKERIEKEDGKNSKDVTCWRCGKRGYRRKWCPHRKSQKGYQRGSSQRSSEGLLEIFPYSGGFYSKEPAGSSRPM